MSNKATEDIEFTFLVEILTGTVDESDIIEQFRNLIHQNKEIVQLSDDDGIPIVYYAAYLRKYDVARFLLSQGGENNQYIASLLGDIQFLKRNLTSENVNIKYTDGFTPLILATRANRQETIDFLLNIGADIEMENDENQSALLHGWYIYPHENSIAYHLLNKGAKHTIISASAMGELEEVKTILESDASLLNFSNPGQGSPLIQAAFYGHLDIVKYLLEQNADPNNAIKRSRGERYPIHSAVASPYPDNIDEIVQLLIDNGADITKVQGGNFNALHEVAFRGRLSTAKLLIENGIPIDVKTEKGMTAIKYAQEKGHKELERYLTNLNKKYR